MTLPEILGARARLQGRVVRTPLRRSEWLTRLGRTEVWLKLECVQLTGSFKLRGALNAAILHAERHAGIPPPLVTASAGNHGRALALAAEHIGVPLTVFVPEGAPRAKTRAITAHGATLREARDYDAAEAAAREFAERQGATYVSPYNNADVIAGAGTVALEIFEDLPDARTVLVPVGGGGLASGVGIVARAQPSSAHMVGVETTASHAFHESLPAGRIVTIAPQPTLADALAGNLEPGTMTFPIMRQVCDRIVLVEEQAIEAAVAGLAREEHLIAEGGGAVAVAAIVSGRVAEERGPVVAIVSGANIDVEKLAPLLR